MRVYYCKILCKINEALSVSTIALVRVNATCSRCLRRQRAVSAFMWLTVRRRGPNIEVPELGDSDWVALLTVSSRSRQLLSIFGWRRDGNSGDSKPRLRSDRSTESVHVKYFKMHRWFTLNEHKNYQSDKRFTIGFCMLHTDDYLKNQQLFKSLLFESVRIPKDTAFFPTFWTTPRTQWVELLPAEWQNNGTRACDASRCFGIQRTN